MPSLEVKVLDFHQGWGRQTVRVPRELTYLKDYYQYDDRSPFCGFHGYYRFGADDEQIKKAIAAENPLNIKNRFCIETRTLCFQKIV